MELPLDRGDVVSLLESLLDVNWKLDRILDFLEATDEAGEESASPGEQLAHGEQVWQRLRERRA
jgi:hypothetical protein